MTRAGRPSYPLGTAIADVVERLVRADATQIHVAVEFAGGDSWIRITGDGRGLTGADLSPQDDGDGMAHVSRLAGLDVATACLTQGHVVTTARREASGQTSLIRWELQGEVRIRRPVGVLPDAVPEVLLEPLAAGAGSVVLIQQLNTVLAFRRRMGRITERHLRQLSQALAAHLALVFHRHLTGHARRPPLTITVGGVLLAPTLPFPPGGWRATPLRRRVLPFVHGMDAYEVRVVPHLVEPADESFFAVPGNPLERGSREGFFVYCADRLVQAGGWNHLHLPSPRGTLLAVVVDVPAPAGAAFARRTAPTMRVSFPPSLIPGLKAVALGSLRKPGPHQAA